MKKYIHIMMSLVLLSSLTACAPKTSQKPSNTANEPTQTTPYAVYETFPLYFIGAEEPRLVKEEHELRIDENAAQEKLILDALKMGPKNDKLTAPMAQSAVIHSIKTVSGLCTVDLSENFLNSADESIETVNLMLHAIVQSLCELDTVQQVKFNIDGNTTAKINDNIDLSQPISPDPANI